jgi:hypothetical protein
LVAVASLISASLAIGRASLLMYVGVGGWLVLFGGMIAVPRTDERWFEVDQGAEGGPREPV